MNNIINNVKNPRLKLRFAGNFKFKNDTRFKKCRKKYESLF